MLREIKQAPEVIARLLQREVRKIEKIAQTLKTKDISMVTFVARGTSDNACLYGKYLIESLLGIPVHLAAPSILTIYGTTVKQRGSLVIGVSQSGEGTDVNNYLEESRKTGAYTLAITNTRGSSITHIADDVIYLHAGHELAVAATKTYIAQCTALLMLATKWADQTETYELMGNMPESAEEILKLEDEITDKVNRYRYAQLAVILGRGYHYASAKELALKLMECCYMPTQAFSIADFMHGPIAMIHEGFPTFLFVTRGKMSNPMIDIAKDCYEKGTDSVIFSNTPETKRYASIHFMLPRSLPELCTPITHIIAGQLFTYSLALTKGLNPDAPKFLKKVTQTL